MDSTSLMEAIWGVLDIYREDISVCTISGGWKFSDIGFQQQMSQSMYHQLCSYRWYTVQFTTSVSSVTNLSLYNLLTSVLLYGLFGRWTFTLLTIYFLCGSLISIYGVFLCNRKRTEGLYAHLNENGMEEGQHVPLLSGKPSNLTGGNIVSYSKEQSFSSMAVNIWSYIFEVLFQINAGAVVLTDCTYWFVIFPFLTIKDYNLSFMTINMHTLNLVLLLGETALNCLTLPRFRISFFFLWTGIYVISQWIVHAFVSIGWPYPFLDLSAPYSPLWYLLMGLIHIPSYGIFMLIITLKHKLMTKWFPQSYQC